MNNNGFELIFVRNVGSVWHVWTRLRLWWNVKLWYVTLSCSFTSDPNECSTEATGVSQSSCMPASHVLFKHADGPCSWGVSDRVPWYKVEDVVSERWTVLCHIAASPLTSPFRQLGRMENDVIASRSVCRGGDLYRCFRLLRSQVFTKTGTLGFIPRQGTSGSVAFSQCL